MSVIVLGNTIVSARHSDGNQYGYTYADFMIGTDKFVIQPIDFVGETPLEPGRWSYQITIDDYATRSASIRAKRD